MPAFIRVWKENSHYVAEIPSLHIVDQGEDMNDLRKNLKEAIELTAESLVRDDLKLKGKKAKEAIAMIATPLIASLDFVMVQKARKLLLGAAKA